MNILKFSTSIKCAACIKAVTPVISGFKQIESWEVDMKTPDRILTVNSSAPLNAAELIEALKTRGYTAVAL